MALCTLNNHEVEQPSRSKNGLRPINLQKDLGAVADLIELCFADTLDAVGRSAVQEMRALASLGPMLIVLRGVDKLLRGLGGGFVWVEDGRIVGNVSIYPTGYAHTWVIANVAVHPEYRRAGIAHQLCVRALAGLKKRNGRAAILQVDADNLGAQALYSKLGFYAERGFTRWHWSGHRATPRPLENMPHITYRSLHEWQVSYELMQMVRPNEWGGMGWMKPTTQSNFGLNPKTFLGSIFSPNIRKAWVVRGDLGVEGLILTQVPVLSGAMQFDLIVHPQRQGQHENPLINYILRWAAGQYYRSAYTDHPTDDVAATEVFRRYGFEARRSLLHMRLDF